MSAPNGAPTAGAPTAAAAPAPIPSPPAPLAEAQPRDALTMWIVIRRDLTKSLGWPTGALVAQAAHASTAVLWKHRDHENVQAYMADVHDMHKVVLEIKNEQQLDKLSGELAERGIEHWRWVEQPENIPTCIATLPYRKSAVGNAFKKCQLFRS